MGNDAQYLSILISRTMFCEQCAKKNRPQKEDFFVVVGGKSGKYKIFEVDSNAKKDKIGFTPHLIQATGLNKNGDVVVLVNCSIHGCGIQIKLIENGTKYSIDFNDVTTRILSVKDWQALLNRWNDSGYEL